MAGAGLCISRGILRKTCALPSQTRLEKACHDLVGLARLRQAYIIPEGMRQCFEDDEVGVNARFEEFPMQNGRSAQQDVASAGDEEGGRESLYIRKQRREDGIFRIGRAHIFGVVCPRIRRIEVAGKTMERVHGPRVAVPAEVAHAGEDAEGSGQRKAKLLQSDGCFGGEDSSGGGSVEADVLRLVALEQLLVDRDRV